MLNRDSYIDWFLRDCRNRDAFMNIVTDYVKNDPVWNVDNLSYKLFKKESNKVQKKYGILSLNYREEQSLIIAKCNGDKEAFVKLFFSQMRMVIYVARKYQNHGLALNDVISEGYFGLWKAIEKIVPSPYRVSTYAIYSIKASIQNAIAKYGSYIRYPINLTSDLSKIQKYANMLLLQNGYIPSCEEIAEACRMNVYKVEDTIRYIHNEISLEYLRSCFYDLELFDEFINETSYNELIDVEMCCDSLNKDINLALSKLQDREAEIIKMYYGIGYKKLSLEEIGFKYDLTRERVRQIKEQAIRMLRGDRFKLLTKYLV